MSTTTIRIDYAMLSDSLNAKGPDAAASRIEAELRDCGITADASDVFSHIKIEVPTAQLVATSAALANMKLI
jgi:hypothetical protein